MSGVIIFDPDNELVGFATGDDLAVGTYLDIETDILYFTDAINIYAWAEDATGYLQTYTWKSGEIRLPSPVNMGAAIVEADAYSLTIGAVAGDDYWSSVIHLGKWEGTDNDTAYTELAQSDTHTFYGNSVIDSAQFNYGATSLFFDGTSDGVQSTGNTIYDLANTDDATMEGFVRFAALPTSGTTMQLFGQGFTDSVNFGAEVRNNAGQLELRGRFGLGNFPAGNITAAIDTWYYFSAQRRYNGGSTVVDLFWGPVSGGTATRVASVSSTNTPGSVTGVPITFGAWDNAITQVFTEVLNGWLDDTRVTKAARYGDVASYTIPTDYIANAGTAGTTYGITFKLYADDVLKHTQTVTSSEPFRLPGGYLSNIYSVEIVSALPVTRVSVAESIFELAEG